MTTQLHFAQISDIHFSSLGDHHDMLSACATEFLSKIISQLNQTQDLDFVLITGDLFDTASRQELDDFQAVICTLQKPCYIIPGNHDRRDADSATGLTRRQFAQYFNPQINARPTTAEVQVGYWSVPVAAKVQLIGLDSTRDQDWGGIIDAAQWTWLENELAAHTDKLIILAVHHPFHELAPIDRQPGWSNFVCDNGVDVLALLEQHPQVKIVFTGHHHLTKADRVDRRIHLACPAMVIYPCAYRTLRLSQTDTSWHFEWHTHPIADEVTIINARQRMLENWMTVFPEDFVIKFVDAAFGTAWDRDGAMNL